MFSKDLLCSSVDVLAYANVNMFILGISSRTTSRKYGQPNNAEEDYRWIQNKVKFEYVGQVDYI